MITPTPVPGRPDLPLQWNLQKWLESKKHFSLKWQWHLRGTKWCLWTALFKLSKCFPLVLLISSNTNHVKLFCAWKNERARGKNKSKPNFPLAFILDVIKRLKRIFQAWLQPDGTAGKFFSIRSLIQSHLVKSLRSHLLKSSIISDLFQKTQSFCF